MASRSRPHLAVRAGEIACTHEGHDLWRLPIPRLALAGEFTNPNGPFVDDYFFVFVDSSDHSWFEASFYSDGRDDFLAQLSDRLGAQVTPGLCSSTDYDSRVMWPPKLRGARLFDFVRVRPGGLRGTIKQWILGDELHMHLTGEVRGYLESRGAD